MTTSHLTPEQLSALLDGALAGRAGDEAGRHLATCAACRDALAALSAQEEALRRTLAHDPGEAYFASFAGRVQERIRAADPAGARVPAAAPSRPASAWGSPRTLAWVGALATVVAGVGLTFLVTRETRVVPLRDERAIERATRASEPAPAADGKLERPLATGAGEKAAAPAPGANETEAAGDRARQAPEANLKAMAAPPAANAPVAGAARPGRAQEVRKDERGEDVPVSPPRGPAALFARPPAPEPTPAPAPGEPVYVKKHAPALPMKEQEQSSLDRVAPAPGAAAPAAPEARSEEITVTSERRLAAVAAPLCGEVRDPAGRPVANASIVLAETATSTTSDADGHFCIAAPRAAGTLAVLAVGYEPVRRSVGGTGAAPALSIVLQPVVVLGGSTTRGLYAFSSEPRDRLPDSLAAAAAGARALTAAASGLKSAPAWEAAASAWSRLESRLPAGVPGHEVRYQLAAARVHAWELAPTDARRAAAAAAVEAWLAGAPPGSWRDQARGWRERLAR